LVIETLLQQRVAGGFLKSFQPSDRQNISLALD
jgi:hypothetical protein